MHSNSGGEVVISGGAFTGNHARSGGGLSNEGGGTLTITGTRFADNSADEQGGGILIQSGAVRMVDIDVIGNVADSALERRRRHLLRRRQARRASANRPRSRARASATTRPRAPGGGIDSRGDGPLSITTTSITGNTAASGRRRSTTSATRRSR